MVRVKTQREVSEIYGKNPNDRAFVSRRIAKGDVIRSKGGYEVCRVGDTYNATKYATIIGNNGDCSAVVSSENSVANTTHSEGIEKLKEEIERLKGDNKLIMEDNNRLINDKVELEDGINKYYEENEELKGKIFDIYKTYCSKYIQRLEFKEKYDLDIYIEGENE